MFKDFTSFNGKQQKAITPELALTMRQAIDTQTSLISTLRDVVDKYTSGYNAVSVIKYDENGDPVDVTPQEKMTVPEHTLARSKALIEQKALQLESFRSILTQASTIEKSVTELLETATPILIPLAGLSFPVDSIPQSIVLASFALKAVSYERESSGIHTINFSHIGLTLPDAWFGASPSNSRYAVWAAKGYHLVIHVRSDTDQNDMPATIMLFTPNGEMLSRTVTPNQILVEGDGEPHLTWSSITKTANTYEDWISDKSPTYPPLEWQVSTADGNRSGEVSSWGGFNIGVADPTELDATYSGVVKVETGSMDVDNFILNPSEVREIAATL